MDKITWRKVWHFIWNDDSIWSWLVNIVLAFVLIKFIVYPGLGWALGTTHPIVAVVSGSMEHDGSFDDWWESAAVCGTRQCTQREFYSAYSISKDDFRKFSFRNGFNTGDIIFLLGEDPGDVEVGQVIVFQSRQKYPIIHRVIEVDNEGSRFVFLTKGDHNPGSGPDDTNISEERLIGKAVFRIPYLGWIKIIFVEIITLPLKVLR